MDSEPDGNFSSKNFPLSLSYFKLAPIPGSSAAVGGIQVSEDESDADSADEVDRPDQSDQLPSSLSRQERLAKKTRPTKVNRKIRCQASCPICGLKFATQSAADKHNKRCHDSRSDSEKKL